MEAFLAVKARKGFEIETRTGTHAVIVERRGALLRRLRRRKRFVVSVDEHGDEVTMAPAEQLRS